MRLVRDRKGLSSIVIAIVAVVIVGALIGTVWLVWMMDQPENVELGAETPSEAVERTSNAWHDLNVRAFLDVYLLGLDTANRSKIEQQLNISFSDPDNAVSHSTLIPMTEYYAISQPEAVDWAMENYVKTLMTNLPITVADWCLVEVNYTYLVQGTSSDHYDSEIRIASCFQIQGRWFIDSIIFPEISDVVNLFQYLDTTGQFLSAIAEDQDTTNVTIASTALHPGRTEGGIPVEKVELRLILGEMSPYYDTIVINFTRDQNGTGYHANVQLPSLWGGEDWAQIESVELFGLHDGTIGEGSYILFNFTDDCRWNYGDLEMYCQYWAPLDTIRIDHGLTPTNPLMQVSSATRLNDLIYQFVVQKISYPSLFNISITVCNVTAGLQHNLTFELAVDDSNNSLYSYTTNGTMDIYVEVPFDGMIIRDSNYNGRLDQGDFIRVTLIDENVTGVYRMVFRYGYGQGEMCTVEWNITIGIV